MADNTGVISTPPVLVCDLAGGGCGEATGEVAPLEGPLKRCPRCEYPAGLVFCPVCHTRTC